MTGDIEGGTGSDTITLAGGSANDIDGGESAGDNDTLIGTAGNDTFNVLAEDGGNVGGGQTFSNIESLDGAGGNDIFNFSAALNGSAIGNAGMDQFIVDVDAGGSAGDFVGGTEDDTLEALNGTNAWTLDGADNGTLNGGTFSGIETVIGGSAVDTFTVTAQFLGSVFGGLGNDVFSLDDAGQVAGGIDGEGDDDTLQGTSGANEFTLTADNEGTMSGAGGGDQSFTGIETLDGRGGNDIFSLAFALDGDAIGGLGDDEFTARGRCGWQCPWWRRRRSGLSGRRQCNAD